jgi:hypothetical protein
MGWPRAFSTSARKGSSRLAGKGRPWVASASRAFRVAASGRLAMRAACVASLGSTRVTLSKPASSPCPTSVSSFAEAASVLRRAACSSAPRTTTSVPPSLAPMSARSSSSSCCAALGTGLIALRSARHRWPPCQSTRASAPMPRPTKTRRNRGKARTISPAMCAICRRMPMPAAPSGASTGSTKRATSAAAIRPASEKTPSCARPGKPENTRAAKPQTEVSRPSRTVGQWISRQRIHPVPGTAAPRAWIR